MIVKLFLYTKKPLTVWGGVKLFSAFVNIKKIAIRHIDCEKIFHDIIYTLSCCFLSNLQGTPLSSTEATETFFAVTKLFQSQDLTLRRLVYLAIKEMSKIADDVIIVTSSLTKDMTGKEDQYRASAIRALTTITDVSVCVCMYIIHVFV